MESLNRKVYVYQNSGKIRFIKFISEGIKAIGEGIEKQHDEDLTVKKKSK